MSLPFEIDATGHGPLGMPAADFLRDYWQKQPLLIRNAFAGFESPLEPDDLAGLACEELALSRLIAHDPQSGQWTVENGPFAEERFPGMPDHDWTLLVQDVDKWDADVAQLLKQFNFLPRWRVDDIMISFAATGGNVGAHVDYYDVFLLQGYGERNWQIDASQSMGTAQPDLSFRDDVDIKLLRTFNATHSWDLKPGDMLYLPPQVPHHGVALNPCLTYSIGMRAPSKADLIGDFADSLTLSMDESARYSDPDLVPATDPHEIDKRALERVRESMRALFENDPDTVNDWFGRFITAYRNPGDIAPNDETADSTAIGVALGGGLLLSRHPWSNMAYQRTPDGGATLYFNGDRVPMTLQGAQSVSQTDLIGNGLWKTLNESDRNAIAILHNAGQYQLTRP